MFIFTVILIIIIRHRGYSRGTVSFPIYIQRNERRELPSSVSRERWFDEGRRAVWYNVDPPTKTMQSYGVIDRIGGAFIRLSYTCRCGATRAAFQWWMVVNSHGWVRARARESLARGKKKKEKKRKNGRTIDGLHRNCIECIRASYSRAACRAIGAARAAVVNRCIGADWLQQRCCSGRISRLYSSYSCTPRGHSAWSPNSCPVRE